MSKLAFDYSKWDNLDTDDSDAEAPAAPIHQEDDTQQKGWRAHADPILQVKDLSKFVISYELEAVFDAQAFDKGTPRAKRALRAVLKGNLARLDSTLAWDHDRAEDAFMHDIKPNVSTTECCYILFRTKTWALFVWAPTPITSTRTRIPRSKRAAVKGGAGRVYADPERLFLVQARGRR